MYIYAYTDKCIYMRTQMYIYEKTLSVVSLQHIKKKPLMENQQQTKPRFSLSVSLQ